MKLVKDAIYNYIRLNDNEKDIVDTPVMQRLRYIRQIALGYLVYPGANHTRFEHSLGTMFLAKRYFEINELDYDNELIAAALLHDVGHGPFSHESEHIFNLKGLSHEDLSVNRILKSDVATILERDGLSPKKVSEYAVGCGIGQLITGALGVDRIDYLMRDSYYAGTVYGKLDYERLLGCISFDGTEPLLDQKGIEAAESLVVSRFMMFATLYQHKAVGISSAMLRKAMEIAYYDNLINVDEFADMTDFECLQLLSKNKTSAKIVERIITRRLYKAAVYMRSYELPDTFRKAIDEDVLSKIEKEICNSCNLDISEIVTYYTYNSYKPIHVSISGKSDLSDISEVVSSIKDATEKKRILFIAVPEEKRELVGKKASDIIKSYF